MKQTIYGLVFAQTVGCGTPSFPVACEAITRSDLFQTEDRTIISIPLANKDGTISCYFPNTAKRGHIEIDGKRLVCKP